MLKILAAYLRNQTLLFLDNIGIKSPKTIYNNEKLALRIKRYVIKHIKNLDKVCEDLKQAGIRIADVKSEFCRASLKIVEYIYNAKVAILTLLKYQKS